MSLGVPPMSKAERLYRWADSLELQKQLQGKPIDDDGWCATPVAFEDWAFQADGLRSEWGDALAFFDLSEDEMRRIVSRSDDGRRTIRPRLPPSACARLPSGPRAPRYRWSGADYRCLRRGCSGLGARRFPEDDRRCVHPTPAQQRWARVTELSG